MNNLTFTYVTRRSSSHKLIEVLKDDYMALHIKGQRDRSIDIWATSMHQHIIGHTKWAECNQGTTGVNWPLGHIQIGIIAEYLKGSNKRKLTLSQVTSQDDLKLITSKQGVNECGYILSESVSDNIDTASALIASTGQHSVEIREAFDQIVEAIDPKKWHSNIYVWFVENAIVLTNGYNETSKIVAKLQITTSLNTLLVNKGFSISILKIIQVMKDAWRCPGLTTHSNGSKAIIIESDIWYFASFIIEKPTISVAQDGLKAIRIPDATLFADFLKLAGNYWGFRMNVKRNVLTCMTDDGPEPGAYLKMDIADSGMSWEFELAGDSEELAYQLELLGFKNIILLVDKKQGLYGIQSDKGFVLREDPNELYEAEEEEENYEEEEDEVDA